MKKCSCGQDLPIHLAELKLGGQHTCSCRRVYDANDEGEYDLVSEHGSNPFADFDEAQAAKKKADGGGAALVVTPEQEVTWERFQLAIGVMATSQYDAVKRLSFVHAILIDSKNGIDAESMPITVRESYSDWLQKYEPIQEAGMLDGGLASELCLDLWHIYQTFRQSIETR